MYYLQDMRKMIGVMLPYFNAEDENEKYIFIFAAHVYFLANPH